MPNNSLETVVADGGSIYIAPVGTTLPSTEVDTLNAAFVDIGYVSEEGVSLNFGQEKTGIKAWQSRGFDIRRLLEARNASFSFTIMQWNLATLEFGLGADATEDTPGHFKIVPRDPADGADQRAFVLEFADGDDRNYRICAAVVEIEGDVSPTLVRNDVAGLAVTVTAIASDEGTPWIGLTDDASLTGAS
jgi:hypothetical protein